MGAHRRGRETAEHVATTTELLFGRPFVDEPTWREWLAGQGVQESTTLADVGHALRAAPADPPDELRVLVALEGESTVEEVAERVHASPEETRRMLEFCRHARLVSLRASVHPGSDTYRLSRRGRELLEQDVLTRAQVDDLHLRHRIALEVEDEISVAAESPRRRRVSRLLSLVIGVLLVLDGALRLLLGRTTVLAVVLVVAGVALVVPRRAP